MKTLFYLSLLLLNLFLVRSGPIADGVYYIINRATVQTLEISNMAYADSSTAGVGHITGEDNQKFQLTSTGGEFYKITALHSARLLTAPSLISYDNQITQWGDGSDDVQLWNIFPVNNAGYYVIQSRSSGKAITVQPQYISVAVDSANATQAEETTAQVAADEAMSLGSVVNKVIHSTINGSPSQEFLFVRIASDDIVIEPVLSDSAVDEVEQGDDALVVDPSQEEETFDGFEFADDILIPETSGDEPEVTETSETHAEEDAPTEVDSPFVFEDLDPTVVHESGEGGELEMLLNEEGDFGEGHWCVMG